MIKTILAAAAVISAGAAHGATLSFDEAFAHLPPALRAGAAIDPSYGDTDLVNVGSGLYAGFLTTRKANEPVIFYDQFNGEGYGEGAPSGVAISSVDGAAGEFSFDAKKAGYEITLESFDVASYPNGDDDITGGFAVLDGDMNVLWSLQQAVGGAVETVTVNAAATDRLLFRWGTSFNIGVDNIVFSLRETGGVSDVPLPPAGALLIAALGGAGFWLTLRRARIS